MYHVAITTTLLTNVIKILSHSFDNLNCGLSAGKPKNNGLLRKKTTVKSGDS